MYWQQNGKKSFLDAFNVMSESLGIKWLVGFGFFFCCCGVVFLFLSDRILSERILTVIRNQFPS